MELLAFRRICCIYFTVRAFLSLKYVIIVVQGEWSNFQKEIPFQEVILRSPSRKPGPWNPGDPRSDAVRPELISDKTLRKLVKTSFPVVSVTWREVTLSDVGFEGGGVEGKLSYTQTGVDYPVSDIRSRNRDVGRLSCRLAECHKVDEWHHTYCT